MKKRLVRLTAIALALASVFTATAFAADFTRGDVDNDGSISNADLLLVARHCVGMVELTGDQFSAADVNEDGEVSNPDLISVARTVIELDIEDPAEVTETPAEKEPMMVSVGKLEEKNDTLEPEEKEPETVEEQPVETKEPAKSYTDDDVYWLSHIIYAEAGGESYKGMVAVGNVVLNRVKSSKFPNTIYGVIFQKYQFTPASSGSIYRTPSSTAVKAAIAALEGENVVGGALYFNTAGLNSWASRNATFVMRIGSHNFYK